MLAAIFSIGKAIGRQGVPWLNQQLQPWTRPSDGTAVLESVTALGRPRSELVLENALRRQQVIIRQHQVKRSKLTNPDRRLLVLLTSRRQAWRSALLVVKPETLFQWQRRLVKLMWRHKSRTKVGRPPLAPEVIALIQPMAKHNPLWGSERIRGERLKLNLPVAKRTLQTYRRQVRPPRPSTQTWRTFLPNPAQDLWACDCWPVINRFFRQYVVFFMVELASRRVVHFGVTAHPTDAWAAHQRREATPSGQGPTSLIRDNDHPYGVAFARGAAGTAIKVLKTPVATPNANAVAERFQGSVRREGLDHLLVLGHRHRYRLIKAYVAYFNRERPHHGLDQRLPVPWGPVSPEPTTPRPVRVCPVLGGLHHVYRRAA